MVCSIRGLVAASAVSLFTVATTVSAVASPILDGSGFGAPSATVAYDPAAPEGNFGTPGTTTDGAAYNIYTRSDSTYMYVLLQENGGGGTAPGSFANLYFGTGVSASTGSDIGFEVTNSDVFVPGGPNPPISTAGQNIAYSNLHGGTAIEFAVAFSYFETDPQHLGFDRTSAADPDIILRLSQSFGYSVAGGSAYGTDRLGLVLDPIGAPTQVPEPASFGLLGLGFATLIARSRRTRQAA